MKGTSNLLSGNQVSKNAPVLHLVGALDELNSHLGLIKIKLSYYETGKDVCNFLETIQYNLLKLMSHTSNPIDADYFFTEADTKLLQDEIIHLKKAFPEITSFVVPGKSETEAFIHIARTVARKAERYFYALDKELQLNEHSGEYLNILSEYLFYLALWVNSL